LKLISVDPETLQSNPWNSNRVDEDNQRKLDNSIERLGNFKPILARELKNGSLQIIGGHHRKESAIRRGETEIDVINLGEVSDEKAKEIGLADNERYGEDDAEALKKLLDGLDTTDELSSFLPISTDEFDSLFAYDSIDLDELDVDDDDDQPIERPEPSSPTHRVVRFKLPIGDAEKLSDFIGSIQKSNGFTQSDDLTNAGDALVHAIRELW